MKTNRKNLLQVLKTVQPGLSSSEIIEQSSAFVFSNGRVFTYNDEIAVSHPVDLKLTGAVPAKELLALLAKIDAEEVELSVEGAELRVVGSRSKAGLRMEEEIALPLKELGEPDGWVSLPKNLIEAIQFCLFSVSNDNAKPMLTCLHLCGQFVESSDGFRLTKYDMGEDSGDAFAEPLLLPGFAAKQLLAYAPTSYARTEGWVHFSGENDVMFSCRVFADEYPNLDRIITGASGGTKIKFPSDLGAILDRAAVFSAEQRIDIEVSEGSMKVKGEGDKGWFEETCPVRFRGEAVAFGINASFMKSIIGINDTAEVTDALVKFTGETFIHVVARLRGK